MSDKQRKPYDYEKECARNGFVTPIDKQMVQQIARKRVRASLGTVPRDNLNGGKTASLESLEDLRDREKQRKADGFPPKTKFRRIIVAPGQTISIPYVEEDSLTHDEFEPSRLVDRNHMAYELLQEDDGDIEEVIGSGEGNVGDVIGEMPIGGKGGGDGEDDGDDEGDGYGQEAGDTEGDYLEEEAFELGKTITEELELPNLTDKKKRFPTNEYTYDLTDRHRRSGQLLDAQATLRRVVETNLVLGRITKDDLDPTKMVIAPDDLVYRILSRERVWKSQAQVFFFRDFSPSMWGEPTNALLSQHLLIYAWLLHQYERRVIPRFLVHAVEAREVSPWQYFSHQSGGWGTFIPSVYQLINNIVEGEGLASDYDIFVFQGTDGEDGDLRGRVAVPEIEKILSYAARMGVTLFRHPYYEYVDIKTAFEQYIEDAGIHERKDVFRMHKMSSVRVSEALNIEALKALIAQD